LICGAWATADSRSSSSTDVRAQQGRNSVRDDEGWFGTKFPDGVDERHFAVTGIIKDLDRLTLIYELFAETLDELCRIGAAVTTPPNVKLK
jgi:hypothetical protein